jgi:DNA-binding response OmpR family regulator
MVFGPNLSGGPGSKGVVLVVDDNEVQRMLFRGALLRMGYDVITARDAPSALDKLKLSQIAGVLLDIVMPGQDGVALCAALRRRLPPATPILFTTASDDEGTVLKGLEAGGDDYLIKPISLKVLGERLERAIQDGKAGTLESRRKEIHARLSKRRA